MIILDDKRLSALIPELFKKVQTSDLPGTYIFEYICYAFVNNNLHATTVYFHEPEWLTPFNSLKQRKDLLLFLLKALGDSFNEEVFMPNGNLIRVDPSFCSCDSSNIMRLEMGYDRQNAIEQSAYIRSLIAYVCGKKNTRKIEELLPSIPAYHSAIELDIEKKIPIALRLYFSLTKENNKAFLGITISNTGKIIARKTYFYINKNVLEKFPCFPTDLGMVPEYTAEKQTLQQREQKIYLFNSWWKRTINADFNKDI